MLLDANIIYDDNKFFVIGDLNFLTVTKINHLAKSLFINNNDICINLSKVTKCDSAALALLIEWVKYQRITKKEIAFENIPRRLLQIANNANLKQLLEPYLR